MTGCWTFIFSLVVTATQRLTEHFQNACFCFGPSYLSVVSNIPFTASSQPDEDDSLSPDSLSFWYTSKPPHMQMHKYSSTPSHSYTHTLWNQWVEQQPIHSISWWILLAVKAMCVHACKYFMCNFVFFVLAASLCARLLGVFTYITLSQYAYVHTAASGTQLGSVIQREHQSFDIFYSNTRG